MDAGQASLQQAATVDKMLKFLLVLGSFLQIFIATGSSIYVEDDDSGRSSNALISMHPYIVSIEHFSNLKCAGVIIARHAIITAAHCVNHPTNEISVRVGSSLPEKGGHVKVVRQVTIHPNYTIDQNNVHRNDIGLIRLWKEDGFAYGENCRYANMFAADETVKAGTKANISGWGSTPHGRPPQLQATEVTIVDRTSCEKAYPRSVDLMDTHFCTDYLGYENSDRCDYDEGGPLVVEGRLAGIFSWPIKCEQTRCPRLFLEVAKYRQWIEDFRGMEEDEDELLIIKR